ncbi:MAG: glycosyltransferase family 2 protein, partial [Bacteroidota bacterium]
MSTLQHIFHVIDWLFLSFSISIASSYFILALISFFAIRNYMKRRSLTDFHVLIGSKLAPPVSLIAPAYNEGPTIIENIRSMLSLEYNNYDVIVVNDGSKDDTLRKVIKAFDLVKVPFFIQKNLTSQQVY